MTDLGPVTESRFREVFAQAAVITAKAAAGLIGVDVKTLDSMATQGLIRAVRKGRGRGYVERDLRQYLLEGPDIECAAPPKPRPTTAGGNVVRPLNFSDRKRRR